PVTDLVDDITADAERIAFNVREFPERVVETNRLALESQPTTNVERVRAAGPGASTIAAGFSPDAPVTFASKTYVIARPDSLPAEPVGVAPLGASQLADALDAIARVLADQPPVQAAPARATRATAILHTPQTGFFASEPEGP
ncbi:MAG: hypothetical protein AAGH64_10190, partial [Planctomycetota bacterium]